MIEAPNAIPWRFIASMAFDTYHHAKFRCEEYGIQRETITNKAKDGIGFAGSQSYYFIDNIDKEFLSLEEMVGFYNEKFTYEEDNPTNEVVWVKVIRNRKN